MDSSAPLRVGVVGAGPWATLVHAPMFHANARSSVAGVWARRADAGRTLADAHGATYYQDFDELCQNCDALTFCVPPDVQAELALRGAHFVKAMLLEKPVSLRVDAARQLAAAVVDAGVVTQLVLTWRYAQVVRDFLDQLTGERVVGARGVFVSNMLRDPTFGTPWRLEHGPLLDLGPHLVDLLEATVGPITTLTARGERLGWISLIAEHQGGEVSEASLFARSSVSGGVQGVEVYTESSVLRLDTASSYSAATFATIADDFIDAVRTGHSPPLDVHHGLHLQELLSQAESQLT